MNLSEINLEDLSVDDFRNIGSAPLAVKIGIIVVLCIAVITAVYFLDTTKQQKELKKVIGEEQVLRKIFVEKQGKAVNLEAYKQQLKEMEASFGTLLRQLPNKTEIETLLTDISQTGISAGLEIEVFKPEGLQPKEFYAEYPIKLKVTGGFHEFAEFISSVAALPRIVTMQNITITPPKDKKETANKLTMDLTAVTYQYIDEKEEEQNTADTTAGAKK